MKKPVILILILHFQFLLFAQAQFQPLWEKAKTAQLQEDYRGSLASLIKLDSICDKEGQPTWKEVQRLILSSRNHASLFQFAKAESLIAKVVKLLDQENQIEPSILAKAYTNIAWVYSWIGEGDEAMSMITKSKELFEKHDLIESPDYGFCLIIYGREIGKSKGMKNGLPSLRKGQQLLETGGKPFLSKLSWAHFSQGWMLGNLGTHKEAIIHTKKALAIRQNLNLVQNENLALIYNNIGWHQFNLGRYKKALESHYQALAIRKSIFGSLHHKPEKSYYNITEALRQINPNQNIKVTDTLIQLRENLYTSNSNKYAWALNSQAMNYEELGNYTEAIALRLQAASTLKSNQEKYALGQTYVSLGANYSYIEAWVQSLTYFDSAKQILNKLTGQENILSTVIMMESLVKMEMGDTEDAKEEIAKIEIDSNKTYGNATKEEIQFATNVVKTYIVEDTIDYVLENPVPESFEKFAIKDLLIGEYLADNNQSTDALEKFKDVLAVEKAGTNNDDIINRYLFIADLYTGQQDAANAKLYIDSAYNFLTNLDANFETTDYFNEVYNYAVTKLNWLSLNDNFNAPEAIRLIAYIANSLDRKAKYIFSHTTHRINLNKNYDELIAIISRLNEQDHAHLIDQHIFHLLEKFRSLIYNKLRHDNHWIKDTTKLIESIEQLTNNPTVFLNSVCRVMNNNQVIIKYDLSDSTCLRTTIDQNNITVDNINLDNQLLADIQVVINKVQSPETPLLDPLILNQIYHKLIDHRVDLAGKELIFIPDGILTQLPFEILHRSSKLNDYLIKSHPISYQYSALQWIDMVQKVHKSKNEVLAFAPDFPEPPLDLSKLYAMKSAGDDLWKLRYSKTELAAIAKYWNTKTFQDEEASVHNFLTNAEDYSILHLSTHGKADFLASENSYLAFTKTASDSVARLYEKDLYGFNLPVNMVVLSACESGTGEEQKGEGAISLGRAFSYAGAKSIISTLWSVNEKSTMDIIGNFYKYLDQGQSKSDALRQAKLDYLKTENSHPFYWAALTASGDMAPISQPINRSLFWVLAAFLLGIGIFVFLRMRN